jgi:hypothetical protein
VLWATWKCTNEPWGSFATTPIGTISADAVIRFSGGKVTVENYGGISPWGTYAKEDGTWVWRLVDGKGTLRLQPGFLSLQCEDVTTSKADVFERRAPLLPELIRLSYRISGGPGL